MPCLDAQLSLCIAATQSTVSGNTALLQQVTCLLTCDLFLRATCGKCFSMMLSGCAGQCGYSMAPIKEVLLAARNKFHDVLSGTMTQAAARAVNEDDLHRVRTFARCATYTGTAAVCRMVALCLHIARDPWGRMASICVQEITLPMTLEATCCKCRHMLSHVLRV